MLLFVVLCIVLCIVVCIVAGSKNKKHLGSSTRPYLWLRTAAEVPWAESAALGPPKRG